MDAIIPPNNQNLVIDDQHRTHHKDHTPIILDRISTATENVMNNDNSNAHSALATAERLGLAGVASTERNGAEGRDNTDRNSMEARLAQREEHHETRSEIRRTEDAIERFGLTNLTATKDGLKDLIISMKDDLKNVLISQKDDIKDLLISNKNDFKDVLLKSCQVEKDALLQFKDAQLIAMQNKADLAREIAECCCENKELIRAEADRTRELMRSLDEGNLRDKLRLAQEELIAVRLRSTLVPLPTAAVSL